MLRSHLDLIEFPDELLLLILFKLTPEEILALSDVCVKFLKLSQDNILWQNKKLQYFPYMSKPTNQGGDAFLELLKLKYFSHLEDNPEQTTLLQFKKRYLRHFASRSKEERQLFSSVIEADNEYLEDHLSFHDLSCTPDFFSYILRDKNQKTLDITYNVIKKHYELGENISPLYFYSQTEIPLLHIAILCNQTPDTIQKLLKNNPDLLFKNIWFLENPLEIAATYNHTKLVEHLLSYKIKNVKTSFMRAVENGHCESLQLLHQYLKENNNLSQYILNNSLYSAAGRGHSEVVKQLINYGAEVNSTAFHNIPPLFAALKKRHSPIVKILLESGADISKVNNPQEDPPILMAAHISPDMIKLLLQFKADVNAVNPRGKTALHYAVFSNKPEAVRILLENGANINALYKGKTALDIAKEKDNNPMIELLTYYKRKNCFSQKNKTSNHVKLGLLYKNDKNGKNSERPTSTPRLSLI